MSKAINFNNLKNQILFLGGLFVFGVFAFMIGNAVNGNAVDADYENQPVVARQPQFVEVESDYSNVTTVDNSDEREVEYDGDVLGAGSQCITEGCSAEAIAFQPLCNKGEGSVDMSHGNGTETGNSVKVRKNATVEISLITAPVALLTGSDIQIDSTYVISKSEENFPYPSADNALPPALSLQYSPPELEGEEGELTQVVDSAHKGDAAFHATTFLEGGEPAIEERVMDADELNNICQFGEDYQWVGETHLNPDITNKIAENINGANYAPGTQVESRSYDNDQCIEPDFSSMQVIEANSYATCVESTAVATKVVNATFSITRWFECLLDEASCEEIELVGIMVDAPFGSNYNCDSGFCADLFFDNAIAGTIDPTEIEDFVEQNIDAPDSDPVLTGFYVQTKCEVLIDGWNSVEVPCYWDVSPYKAFYDLQAADTAPSDDDLPTWEEYWYYVEQLADMRSGKCLL